MRIAFLTEMNFRGKIPSNHLNMRTEFAWMCALNADHYFIRDWNALSGYDYVMIILPKGGVFLNSEGKTLTNDKNAYSDIFSSSIISDLKQKNKSVCFIQEGPTWFVNDFNLQDQFNFYNILSECDILFSHNEYDKNWYKGLYPNKRVEVMPTLMIEDVISNIKPTFENKVIIGGNFSRWYGGFQSYMVASESELPIFVQTSHSSREGEDQIPSLTILPRLVWSDWIKTLSTFKYAVHLMPTIAAGTFSLNCAYFGIPCIGNKNVDTQRFCFPDLSFYPEDVHNSRLAMRRLIDDGDFYKEISEKSKILYKRNYSKEIYLSHLNSILGENIELTVENEPIEEITVVFTSCGRFDLLKTTIESFKQHCNYPIKKYIVIDNSTLPNAKDEIKSLLTDVPNDVIVNETNIGQISSIDKAYELVNTKFIFHCEDDWEFYDYDFIQKSLNVLKYNDKITNVNLRRRFDGSKGSMAPIGELKSTDDNTKYHEYEQNYLGVWHGFSWNPGLRRLSDYDLVKPYKKFGDEVYVGQAYKEMGYKSACLEKCYCKHIGDHSVTPLSNK